MAKVVLVKLDESELSRIKYTLECYERSLKSDEQWPLWDLMGKIDRAIYLLGKAESADMEIQEK